MAALEILQFPCWNDNYGVLIHDAQAGVTASIDAPEEDAVREALQGAGLKLTHIFTTHHHHDHVGGHGGLKRETGCKIYGPAQEAQVIPGIDVAVEDGDRIPFGSFEVQVLGTPGHTRGAVSYYIADAIAPGQGVAFTGDTMFSMGCGRVFEGTHAQLWHSLEKIAALPASTLIYCGHEYTRANLRFALAVEPGNEALLKRKAEVDKLTAQLRPTLPVLLATELETNPFLRVNSPAIRESLGLDAGTPPEKVFEALRRRKDTF